MRLLNVHTMKLEEYFGSQIPEYAILSHCWGAEEVTFQHINGYEWHDMPGATKIKYVSSYCKEQGFHYVWIDTCCIDKSSSAELSEAINSMYGWYEGSVVCYAYLEDVEYAPIMHVSASLENKYKAIRKSRWFNRGWTLQELIAPKEISFFNRQWRYLGSKGGLSPLLSNITTIPEDVLVEPEKRRDFSVARKMTWAAKRQTTRIEDVAYSLLGIFDVNMPLLYGEGQKAFTRLQEEILKETDDQSLLAWGLIGSFSLDRSIISTGVFANSPEAFLGSENVVPFPSKPGRQPQSMTNRGVRIEVPLSTNQHFPILDKSPFAILDCHYKNDFSGAIGIPLISTRDDSIFLRHPAIRGITYPALEFKDSKVHTIYISKRPPTASKSTERETCLIRAPSAEDKRYNIFPVISSPGRWDEKTKVLSMEYRHGGWLRERASMAIAFCNLRMKSCFLVMVTLIKEGVGFSTKIRTLIKIVAGPATASRLILEKLVRESQQNNSEASWKGNDTIILPSVSNLSERITVNADIKREEILNQEVFVLSVTQMAEKWPYSRTE
ncbi:heterokaryon incompatibility protein-domain-containing protein [Tricladium varicosporioides]|nr:heterokaryon incompatibility protein-domain-containing protein [Hymenoscyphus varicosporioides]